MSKQITLVLFFVCSILPSIWEAHATTSLPECKGNDPSRFNNCYGSFQRNGEHYVGDWKDGRPHGTGTYTSRQGGFTYVGQFTNGMRHGNGTLNSQSGVYVGEFLNDMLHGQGSITLIDGSKYTGDWRNNQPDGRGFHDYGTGGSFEGQLKAGKRHGQGVLINEAGNKYVGEFVNDIVEGLGIVFNSSGEITAMGRYQAGVLVSEEIIDDSRFNEHLKAVIRQENVRRISIAGKQ